MLYRPNRTQYQWLFPAGNTIAASCVNSPDSTPSTLLHLFSNGGSHQCLNLVYKYKKRIFFPFPKRVTILDPCVRRGTFLESIKSISAFLPPSQPLRAVLFALLYLTMCFYWLTCVPLGIPDPIERIRQALNDKQMIERRTQKMLCI